MTGSILRPTREEVAGHYTDGRKAHIPDQLPPNKGATTGSI